MALDEIAVGDSDGVARAKFAAVLGEAAKVATIEAALDIETSQRNSQVAALQAADGNETTARVAADFAEAAARAAGDATLMAKVDGIAIAPPGRAGELQARFTSVLTGAAANRAPLAIGSAVASDRYGAVLAISAAAVAGLEGAPEYADAAPRYDFAIEDGHVYRVRAVFERLTDALDPFQNAVELRFQNLNKNKASVSNVRWGDARLVTVAGGPLEISVLIGRGVTGSAADSVEYVPPSTTRYFTPYFRIYGAGGPQVSGVVLLWLEDVTDQIAGGVDVSDLRSDVTGLTTSLATETARATAAEATERADRRSRVTPLSARDSSVALDHRALGTALPWTPGVTTSPSDVFLGWSWAHAPDAEQMAGILRFMLRPAANAAKMTIQMWTRPLTVGDGGNPIVKFGAHAADVEIYPLTSFALGDLGLAADQFGELAIDLAAFGLTQLYPDTIYAVTVRCLTSGDAETGLTMGRGPNAATDFPRWKRGWYTLDGSLYAAVAGTGTIAATVTYRKAEAGRVSQKRLDLADMARGTDTMVAGTSFAGISRDLATFKGFSIGGRVPTEARVRSRLVLGTSGAVAIRRRIYRRPLADAASTTVFGAGGNDVLLDDRTTKLAALGLTDGVMGIVEQDHSDLGLLDPAFLYGWRWEAVSSTGAVTFLAVGNGPTMTGAPAWQRGWYSTDATAYAVFSGSTSFSFELLVDVPAGPASLRPTVLSAESPTIKSGPRTVSLPASSIWGPSGTIDIAAQTVTLDAVTANAGVTGTITLASVGVQLPTQYQYFGAITVTRVSDSVVMVEGTNYRADREAGRLVRLSGASNFDVGVSFTGYTHRYDLIHADAVTGAIGVTKGTDRIVDPEMYKPVLPAGKIALYEAYVWRDGVDLLPVHKARGRVRRDHRSDWLESLEINRQRIARTLAKARRGWPITIVGYGDSTMAGGGGEDAPNGTTRETVAFFAAAGVGRHPADTIASLAKYDLDGTRNDSTGLYTHVGYLQRLKQALGLWGSDVNALNYAWSGTRSNNEFTNSRPGGLYPARMATIIAAKPDLVAIAFGMNELGSTATEANVIDMATQFKAAGAEVVIISPMMIGLTNINSLVLKDWQFTHDALWRAAEATDSAFISAVELFGQGQEMCGGLSRRNFANQNLINHGGLFEFGVYGDYMARVVAPAVDATIVKSDQFDVTAYRASPSASAADNLAAFRAADAAAVRAGGGVLYVPAGKTFDLPDFDATKSLGQQPDLFRLSSGNRMENRGTIDGAVIVEGQYVAKTNTVTGSGSLVKGVSSFSGDFSAYAPGDIVMIELQGLGGSVANGEGTGIAILNQFGVDFLTVATASGSTLTTSETTRWPYNSWKISKVTATKISGTFARGTYSISGDYRAFFTAGDTVRLENLNGTDTFWTAFGKTVDSTYPALCNKAYFEYVKVKSVTDTAITFEQTLAYSYTDLWLAKASPVRKLSIEGGTIKTLMLESGHGITVKDVDCADFGYRFLMDYAVTDVIAETAGPYAFRNSHSRGGTVTTAVARGASSSAGNAAFKALSLIGVTLSDIVADDMTSSGSGCFGVQTDCFYTPYSGFMQDCTIVGVVADAPKGSTLLSAWFGGHRDCHFANIEGGAEVRFSYSQGAMVSNVKSRARIQIENSPGGQFRGLDAPHINGFGVPKSILGPGKVRDGSANSNRCLWVATGTDVLNSDDVVIDTIINESTSASDTSIYLANASGAYIKGCADKAGLAASVAYGASVSSVRYGENAFRSSEGGVADALQGTTVSTSTVVLEGPHIKSLVLSAASALDVTSITGALAGQIVQVRRGGSNNITLKDASSGGNTFRLVGGDCVIDATTQITLMHNGSSWSEIARGVA